MKKPKITAKDVAREAGVSVSTVSMILNNYKDIRFSEETKSRVLEVCGRLGYRTIGNSRLNMITGKLLLVICPSYVNAHYVGVINAIQQRAQELGYATLNLCTRRDENEEITAVRICRELPIAGVLLLYQPENTSVVQMLSMEKPFTQLYERSVKTDVNILELDNYKIGRLIAEHLINLGHKNIAHISKPLTQHQPARIRRIDGIRSYMQECGLDPDQHLRISTVETEHLDVKGTLEGYETGYLLAGHLIDAHAHITAFAATNDVVAYGIMDAILERGKRVPQDYSVCGCDNLPDSGFHRISLTSVEAYTRQKARDAVDLLVKTIESKYASPTGDDGPVSITRIEYMPRLIARKSTGKCPEKQPTHTPE